MDLGARLMRFVNPFKHKENAKPLQSSKKTFDNRLEKDAQDKRRRWAKDRSDILLVAEPLESPRSDKLHGEAPELNSLSKLSRAHPDKHSDSSTVCQCPFCPGKYSNAKLPHSAIEATQKPARIRRSSPSQGVLASPPSPPDPPAASRATKGGPRGSLMPNTSAEHDLKMRMDASSVKLRGERPTSAYEDAVESMDNFDDLLDFYGNSKRSPTCLVCLEEVSLADSVGRVTESCEHTDDICFDCLSRSMEAQMDSKFWDQLSCPICSKPLDYAAVRRFARPESFERYDTMATRHCITNLSGWWECPQPGCGFGGEYRNVERAPEVTCQSCKYSACFKCEVKWHKGQTCKQYKAELKRSAKREVEKKGEEAAAEQTMKKTTKSCPGPKCSVRIEKDKGCHHMRCSRCGHQFCWDCLTDWKSISKYGNDVHQLDCRWHPKNLRHYPLAAMHATMVADVHNRA